MKYYYYFCLNIKYKNMESVIYSIVILFTIYYLVKKFSVFRTKNGYNRILKKEYLKQKNENNLNI